MSSSPPLVVADRYRLVAPLGQGGMGRVWRATDVVLHRDVAIKELVPPPGLTPGERQEMRERSLREARAIARLNNVNVVRVFDVLRTDADPWIVMEYVPSRSLQDTLAADGPFSPIRAAEMGLGVLGALRAAHRAGVVHRDVKPGNVLIGADGRVVLTDFGLATVPGDPNVTRTGLVLGSPAYIAPERARDGTAGPAADLWSLGATLYAAVEGASPFARPSAIATLAALATENPPPARNAGPLKPVLNGLLRKDPTHRINAEEAERLLLRAAGRKSRLSFPMSPTMRRPGLGRERPALPGAPGAVLSPTGSAPVVPGPRPPVAPARPGNPPGRTPAGGISPAAGEGRPPTYVPGKAQVGRPAPETPTRVDGPKVEAPRLDATRLDTPPVRDDKTTKLFRTPPASSDSGERRPGSAPGLSRTSRGGPGGLTAADVAANRRRKAAPEHEQSLAEATALVRRVQPSTTDKPADPTTVVAPGKTPSADATTLVGKPPAADATTVVGKPPSADATTLIGNPAVADKPAAGKKAPAGGPASPAADDAQTSLPAEAAPTGTTAEAEGAGSSAEIAATGAAADDAATGAAAEHAVTADSALAGEKPAKQGATPQPEVPGEPSTSADASAGAAARRESAVDEAVDEEVTPEAGAATAKPASPRKKAAPARKKAAPPRKKTGATSGAIPTTTSGAESPAPADGDAAAEVADKAAAAEPAASGTAAQPTASEAATTASSGAGKTAAAAEAIGTATTSEAGKTTEPETAGATDQDAEAGEQADRAEADDQVQADDQAQVKADQVGADDQIEAGVQAGVDDQAAAGDQVEVGGQAEARDRVEADEKADDQARQRAAAGERAKSKVSPQVKDTTKPASLGTAFGSTTAKSGKSENSEEENGEIPARRFAARDDDATSVDPLSNLNRPTRPAWRPMEVRPPAPRGGVTVFGTRLTYPQAGIGAGIVLVVVVLLIILGVKAFGDGDRSPATGLTPTAGTSAAPTTNSSPPATSAAAVQPSAGPSTGTPAPSSSPPPAAGSPALPPGWKYRDLGSFSLPLPPNADSGQSGDGLRVRWDNRLLLIDQGTDTKPSALKDWQQQAEQRSGSYNNYHLIRIAPAASGTFKNAADWEFLYTTSKGNAQHVIRRSIVISDHQWYTISVYTTPEDWAASQPQIQALFQGFKPKS